MLMSLDTSTTSRLGCCSRSACTTPRIWLSALPCGRPAGRVTSSRLVWKNSLPPASRWPVRVERQAVARCSASRVGMLAASASSVAADLAGVARDLGHALLVAVELLQHDHRQEDVVLLEAEQAHRVVHQHVGVEHEQLGRAGCRAALRALRLGGGARRRPAAAPAPAPAVAGAAAAAGGAAGGVAVVVVSSSSAGATRLGRGAGFGRRACLVRGAAWASKSLAARAGRRAWRGAWAGAWVVRPR